MFFIFPGYVTVVYCISCLMPQWPRFHVVISSCFVHSRFKDRSVIGSPNKKHGGVGAKLP